MALPHQDWKPVILHNSSNKNVATKKSSPQFIPNPARKLEADISKPATEEAPPLAALNILSSEMRQLMINARIAKKMSQADLAKKVNVQTCIINQLESGKVVNEPNILQNIRKILGISLKFK